MTPNQTSGVMDKQIQFALKSHSLHMPGAQGKPYFKAQMQSLTTSGYFIVGERVKSKVEAIREDIKAAGAFCLKHGQCCSGFYHECCCFKASSCVKFSVGQPQGSMPLFNIQQLIFLFPTHIMFWLKICSRLHKMCRVNSCIVPMTSFF